MLVWFSPIGCGVIHVRLRGVFNKRSLKLAYFRFLLAFFVPAGWIFGYQFSNLFASLYLFFELRNQLH